jgi:hypothetical protein
VRAYERAGDRAFSVVETRICGVSTSLRLLIPRILHSISNLKANNEAQVVPRSTEGTTIFAITPQPPEVDTCIVPGELHIILTFPDDIATMLGVAVYRYPNVYETSIVNDDKNS